MYLHDVLRSSRKGISATVALTAALALPACASSLSHVWIDDVAPADIGEPAVSGDYLIATSDLLTIRVYNQDAISTHGRVRPDGMISVPLAGEIQARGLRPADLAKEIEARLKLFVLAPAVSVIVEETRPIRVSVLGEVARPGVFVVEPGTGVLQALAMAGGTTEFAASDRIFVVRSTHGGAPLRIRFSYAKLTGDSRRAARFTLTAADVVMVE